MKYYELGVAHRNLSEGNRFYRSGDLCMAVSKDIAFEFSNIKDAMFFTSRLF